MAGSPNIIDMKYTGGYLFNTWYNIKIRAQNSNIVIYMTDQKENIEKRYEKIFDFNDNEMMQGTIAFTSLGNKFLLIDNISIIPIPCTNFDEREGASQLILTPTCPRFTEDFKNDFISRWSVVDPLETVEGPSNWQRQYEVQDREMVLAQKSNISGVSQFEEGTIFLLKQGTKVCSQGKFSIKFKASSEGIIGMIFRYTDKGDYYLLEISGERDKFVRFRKKMGGIYQHMSSKPNIGYNLDQWYSITILMNENRFNVYMTNENIFEKEEKIFEEDIQDPDIKIGYIGLSTYKTPAFFYDISITPVDNLDEKENLLYVDEESLERKILLILVPKKKINTLIGKLNMNIDNFTWGKCLVYPNPEDRIRYCDVLFQSKQELQQCKVNS
jgi:hypothetical protein